MTTTECGLKVIEEALERDIVLFGVTGMICDAHLKQALQICRDFREKVPDNIARAADHWHMIEGEIRTKGTHTNYTMSIPAQSLNDSDFLFSDFHDGVKLLASFVKENDNEIRNKK